VDSLLGEASRLALFGLVLMWFLERQQSTGDEFSVSRMGLGIVLPSPQIEISEDEEGICHVRLPGGLELHIDGKVPFYKRMQGLRLEP